MLMIVVLTDNTYIPLFVIDSMKKLIFILLVMLASYCSLLYELLLAHTMGLLFGDTVIQYSLTIGIYLFSLGIGSFLTDRLKNARGALFWVEIALSIIGSVAAIILLFNQDFILLSKLFGDGLPLWIVNAIFYLPVLAIGILSGMEIPLFYRIAEGSSDLSRVLAYDYFGSLVAAVLFPLVLLPAFGMVSVGIITGLLNLVIALCLLYKSNLRKILYVVVAFVGLVLVCLLIQSENIEVEISERFVAGVFRTEYVEFEDHFDLLSVEQTQYQSFYFGKRDHVVNGSAIDNYFLILDKEFQMESAHEKNYHEPYVHPLFCLVNVSDVLIIGGGDGMLTREVLKYDSVERVDHIDIDSFVTDYFTHDEIGRMLNNDSFWDPRVNLVNTDGISFMRENDKKYDVIFFDLPSPIYEAIARFHSVEVYKIVLNNLNDEGFFITHTAQNHAPYQASSMDKAGFSHIQEYKIDIWQRYLLGANFDFNYGEVSQNFFCEGLTQVHSEDIYRTTLNGSYDFPIEIGDTYVNSIYKPNIKFFREPYDS